MKDISGNVYGRLTVISFSHMNRNVSFWSARCECGVIKTYRGAMLKNGHTKSCGCLRRELTAARMRIQSKTHGLTYSPEWRSWRSMKNRCLTPTHKSYDRYKNISICDRWIDSFENFLADMGPKPRGTSLDRIDTYGGYSPENCRWATPQQQARNTSRNRIIEHNGQSLTLKEWAEKIGVARDTIARRLRSGRYSIAESLYPGSLKKGQPLIAGREYLV